MPVILAPSYPRAQAAWIPRFTIWRDDGAMDHEVSISNSEVIGAAWTTEAFGTSSRATAPAHNAKNLVDRRSHFRHVYSLRCLRLVAWNR